jgi:hypothetical protein
MDEVQNCDSYINIPSSQTYGSFCASCLLRIQLCNNSGAPKRIFMKFDNEK